MNKITDLLERRFSTLPLEEKLRIKKLGRPTPDLNIVKVQASGNKQVRTRKFNPSIYSKNTWICGCEEKNLLYCFPCVLFNGKDTMWSLVGTSDLVHIWDKMATHEKSKGHLDSAFSLSVLGKNIRSHLNSTYRQHMILHNEQVDRNRHVLNIIINCIRFCGALELVLRGQEDDGSQSKVFRELIDFTSEFDKDLKLHMSKSSVFKGKTKRIQNELLSCMLDVYHEEVTNEIKSAEYVALMVEETLDTSCEFQLVIFFRYIANDRPVERFWKFASPAGRDSVSISECILAILDSLIGDTPNKLVCQSYDGASLMNGGLDGVQKIIKERYRLASYVHCYAHQANSILASTASANRRARIFFAHLSGICSFFSTSPRRLEILERVVRKRPLQSRTKWDFSSNGIRTVFEYREELIEVMDIIENSDDVRLQSTIAQAGAYKYRLNDNDFIFWLTVFQRITPHIDAIFGDTANKYTNPIKIAKNFNDFVSSMEKIRDDIDLIGAISYLKEEDEEVHCKRPRLDSENREAAVEVCDAILHQVRARFHFTGHLVVSNLFLVKNFRVYQKRFPDHYLAEMVTAFPFLDKHRLKNELWVFYDRDEFTEVSGAVPLLAFLLEDDIRDTFRETLKLIKLLVTIPMPTKEVERCFPTLKRIKTFLRNTRKDERLSALGMLSAEKNFLDNIDNFNKKVIQLFASKPENATDFSYRKA